MTENSLISTVFRPEVLALSSYHVQNAQGLIKLDAMENPYDWPESIQSAWLDSLKNCPLNRYPDPEAQPLKQTLKRLNGISEEFELLLGNGSDEIIQLLLMALPPAACVLSPAPGFVMYKQISDSLGLNYLGIPLLEGSFALDLPAILTAIEQQRPALIFIAYPNNPTGNLFDRVAIETIIRASTGLVVIDEAYAPFADASFMGDLGRYPNLLVMRTVSKLGLAGLRLGYIVGTQGIIEQLNKIRLPYNINILTQITADFALNHNDLFQQQTEAICSERARVSEQLTQLPGFIVYPSQANFILFKTPKNQADSIFIRLKQQGVLIKNLSPQGGLLADCLRVTIGKSEENTRFLQALHNSLEN